MTRSRSVPVVEIAVAAAAIVAIAVSAYLAGKQSESAAGGVDSRSTYDATGGGYRAWYEMLQREGIRVERFEDRPAFLDRSVDVYVLSSNTPSGLLASEQRGEAPGVFSDGDWYALAKWVKGGGRLVWVSDGVDSPDYLNAPEFTASGPAADNAVTVAPAAIARGVASVSGTSRLRVPLWAERAPPVIADDTGSVVASYPLGTGEVTIVSDQTLFENERFGRADNATLAYDLATDGLTPHGAVAFDEWSHGHQAGDSWWAILPPPFQVAFVLAAAALVVLGVGTALRFGPVVRIDEPTERTSAEYLASMAVLYRRGRGVREAIGEMADACLRDVAVQLGLSDRADVRDIARRAAGAAGAATADLVMELDRIRSFERPNEQELVRAAVLCIALRKELSPHARIGIGRRAAAARRPA